MNHISIFSTIAIATLLSQGCILSGCSYENSEPDAQFPQDVKQAENIVFGATFPQNSKASETSFDTGDLIDVYPFEGYADVVPEAYYVYRYDGNLFRANSSPIMKLPGASLLYYALYPSKSVFSYKKNGNEFRFPQNPPKDICQGGTYEFTASSAPDLRFDHLTSRICINVSGTKVSRIRNIDFNAVYEFFINPYDNEDYYDSTNFRYSTMYKSGNIYHTYIAPNQKIYSGAEIIRIQMLDGTIYLFELADTQTYLLGCSYTFDLNIDNAVPSYRPNNVKHLNSIKNIVAKEMEWERICL